MKIYLMWSKYNLNILVNYYGMIYCCTAEKMFSTSLDTNLLKIQLNLSHSI